MSIEPGSVEHLSEIISHVVAPAFLLSGVGLFASILTDRLTLVVTRIGQLTDAAGEDLSATSKTTLIRLRRRAVLLNVATLLAVASGAFAMTMIIAAFSAALLNMHHVWVAAALFIISSFLLLCSLVVYAVDIKTALSGHDLH